VNEGMSSPGIGRIIYRTSPEIKKNETMNSKNKIITENNMMKVEYPSFGEGHPSKQSSLEESRHFEELKENEEVREELQSYIQFLVSKYDDVQDKDELENLLLEIHHLNSLNLEKVPDDFKNKLNYFIQNSVLEIQKLETPKKEESKLIMTGSKKKQSPNTLIVSQISHVPKNGDVDARICSDFMDMVQNNPHLLGEYEELVSEYEESRQEIKAKQLMKYKSLCAPTKIDQNIGVALMYFFYQIDNSIPLRTDKRQLEDKSWNSIKQYFSN
jgi:hypothetical protein